MASTHSNPVKEYYDKISSGEIVTSRKVIAAYAHIVSNMHNESCPYHYDEDKANHAISFVEKFCKQSKGKAGGTPIKLELWQRAFISVIFGMVDEQGFRQYREAIMIVGRKNGKSTLASAIGLYLLTKDGEPGPEIYSVASKKDQARVIWDESVKMIHKSPALKKRCKTLVSVIKCEYNDGTFRALAADSNSLDGLNVHGALLDEVHAWKDKNLYDVVVDGESARQQPLTLITTTAGTVRESIYDLKYDECAKIIAGYDDGKYVDERVFATVYELDNSNELYTESAWKKANPGLGTIKSLDTLRAKVHKAKADDRLEKNLLCKDFDLPQTSLDTFLSFEDIQNPARFDITELPVSYGIGGIDLSETMDLTCASMLFKVPGREELFLHQMYWIPEDLLQKHIQKDAVPYDTWVQRGLIRVCPGNRIDFHRITQWFQELQDEYGLYLHKCGYDPWGAQYLTTEMEQYFGSNVMEKVIQGKKTLSLPMQDLKALMQKRLVNYNDNPVYAYCCANVLADSDVNGNIQPAKDRAKNVRIDGFASALDAYTIYTNNMEAYEAML